LQRLQSRAARVLTGINYDIHSADLLETLSWDTLDVINGFVPSQYYSTKYLMTAPGLINSRALSREGKWIRQIIIPDYHLRNSVTDRTLPKPNREFLKKDFTEYSGAI
jgi:hypothetical protein